jgi:hypothetical protein
MITATHCMMGADSHETWKCAEPELERQIRCFPYGDSSDVPRLQQVEQKAVGRQRNLGLGNGSKKTYNKFSIRNPYINRFTNHFSIHS